MELVSQLAPSSLTGVASPPGGPRGRVPAYRGIARFARRASAWWRARPGSNPRYHTPSRAPDPHPARRPRGVGAGRSSVGVVTTWSRVRRHPASRVDWTVASVVVQVFAVAPETAKIASLVDEATCARTRSPKYQATSWCWTGSTPNHCRPSQLGVGLTAGRASWLPSRPGHRGRGRTRDTGPEGTAHAPASALEPPRMPSVAERATSAEAGSKDLPAG
jgi:hypothetical protein